MRSFVGIFLFPSHITAAFLWMASLECVDFFTECSVPFRLWTNEGLVNHLAPFVVLSCNPPMWVGVAHEDDCSVGIGSRLPSGWLGHMVAKVCVLERNFIRLSLTLCLPSVCLDLFGDVTEGFVTHPRAEWDDWHPGMCGVIPRLQTSRRRSRPSAYLSMTSPNDVRRLSISPAMLPVPSMMMSTSWRTGLFVRKGWYGMPDLALGFMGSLFNSSSAARAAS